MTESNVSILVQLFKLEKMLETVIASVKREMAIEDWRVAWERFDKYFCE